MACNACGYSFSSILVRFPLPNTYRFVNLGEKHANFNLQMPVLIPVMVCVR